MSMLSRKTNDQRMSYILYCHHIASIQQRKWLSWVPVATFSPNTNHNDNHTLEIHQLPAMTRHLQNPPCIEPRDLVLNDWLPILGSLQPLETQKNVKAIYLNESGINQSKCISYVSYIWCNIPNFHLTIFAEKRYKNFPYRNFKLPRIIVPIIICHY